MKYELTARRIREAMSDLGMSQQELADKSQLGKSSISHYVNGSNEPGNKSAYVLAKVLNVNPAWLMGLDVQKERIESSANDDTDKMKKAMELLELYENATPQAQELVENFLKSSQDKK